MNIGRRYENDLDKEPEPAARRQGKSNTIAPKISKIPLT